MISSSRSILIPLSPFAILADSPWANRGTHDGLSAGVKGVAALAACFLRPGSCQRIRARLYGWADLASSRTGIARGHDLNGRTNARPGLPEKRTRATRRAGSMATVCSKALSSASPPGSSLASWLGHRRPPTFMRGTSRDEWPLYPPPRSSPLLSAEPLLPNHRRPAAGEHEGHRVFPTHDHQDADGQGRRPRRRPQRASPHPPAYSDPGTLHRRTQSSGKTKPNHACITGRRFSRRSSRA